MPVLAGAEPFQHAGTGGTGVSSSRGFTGTPLSMRGGVVEPVDSRVALDGIGTDPAQVTGTVLHDSSRVATLDGDAPLLFERSSEFAAAGRQVGTK